MGVAGVEGVGCELMGHSVMGAAVVCSGSRTIASSGYHCPTPMHGAASSMQSAMKIDNIIKVERKRRCLDTGSFPRFRSPAVPAVPPTPPTF